MSGAIEEQKWVLGTEESGEGCLYAGSGEFVSGVRRLILAGHIEWLMSTESMSCRAQVVDRSGERVA